MNIKFITTSTPFNSPVQMALSAECAPTEIEA